MGSEAKAWVCVVAIIAVAVSVWGVMSAARDVGIARAKAC